MWRTNSRFTGRTLRRPTWMPPRHSTGWRQPEYLAANGVQNYMKYADAKLKEEEQRAMRYLETRKGCNSVSAVSLCFVFSVQLHVSSEPLYCFLFDHQISNELHLVAVTNQRSQHFFSFFSLWQLTECCVNVLVTAFKETILAECAGMIKNNETERELPTMRKLVWRNFVLQPWQFVHTRAPYPRFVLWLFILYLV